MTFAFTDIEGSTQRWERDRAAMDEAVRRHDDLIRRAIATAGGVVFKTVGDEFCAAFGRPEDAVAAMLAAQHALAGEDFSAVGGLRVRGALHTGTAYERNGDYFGPAVNRVARLLATAHGGQVVVSAATADLVGELLGSGVSLADLGEHRLRDLARPERVFQLRAPGLPSQFPPLRSLSTLSNNLPPALTSFIGRDAEVAEITALLERHRLVTIVGAGGVGKTRTAVQVAANLLDGSGDGVWLLELAPLAEGTYIPSAVAQVFGLTLPPDGDPIEALVRLLHEKRALLVFDNCEHLVESAARVVSALLRGSPKLKMLATSRQGLGIEGEHLYRLPSLSVPVTESRGLSGFEAMQSEAIALFAERAQAADNRFLVTDDNAAVVAEICRRLDGIPLAIELAAARVKILSPRQLRERLDERFRVLTGGSRDVLPRQQTLRALIDWSYELLDEREKLLFRRVAVFVNGFTIEGAVGVAGADGLDELDVLDVLGSLVDKSLVLAEPIGDALRYRLLESTRAYAIEKLDLSGERDACECRRLQYLESAIAEMKTRAAQGRSSVHEFFVSELEDVRGALAWAVEHDVTLGALFLGVLGSAWTPFALEHEAAQWCEAFLARNPEEPRILARLWLTFTYQIEDFGNSARVIESARRGLAFARAAGDRALEQEGLITLATNLARARRADEAKSALAEADAIGPLPERQRSRRREAMQRVLHAVGDYDVLMREYEEQLRELESTGDEQHVNITRACMAEVEHERGCTERAITLARETVSRMVTSSDHVGRAMAQMDLVGYLTAAGELEEARAAGVALIHLTREREDEVLFEAMGIEHLALALALSGDEVRYIAQLAGYGQEKMRAGGDDDPGFTQLTTRGRLVELLEERLESAEREELIARGAVMTRRAATALALELAEGKGEPRKLQPKG